MLGEIGGMEQTYPCALPKWGDVINTVVINATAKAPIYKYPNTVANVDIGWMNEWNCFFSV